MKINQLTPEEEVLKELAQRLARIRKAQGYSQTQLAEEAGIGVATLRRIEAGQDSQLQTWVKILKALNMVSAIDALLPQEFRSPMAEVLSGKSKRTPIVIKRPRSGATLIKKVPRGIWGDEIDFDPKPPEKNK